MLKERNTKTRAQADDIEHLRYSLQDLLTLMPDTASRIRFNYCFSINNDQRTECVNCAIEYAGKELARWVQYKQRHSEDALTVEIVSLLRSMGMSATHDSAIGGHCDIAIEGRDDFLWIGEAKINRGCGYLYAGLKQLLTRYSTGAPGQNTGGIIVYCFNSRIDRAMQKWRQYVGKMQPATHITQAVSDPSWFASSHRHQRTGRPFVVRHVAISLHFDPQDRH
ncbi:hypothetical protein Mesop_5507 [Mesorhizobium opportunistum WSM2075]|uniref:Uncharacterized protein n=1 Tax=Mesorhizobium opportunistum (strain LMG 24607 / HAMBI 3007 / WSM2075) TaxID=536019 RepID=F7YAU4_MESOW|nr:hypothetical protein Mesop_5507 [Mesorhizobium opportunistum WSM2075]